MHQCVMFCVFKGVVREMTYVCDGGDSVSVRECWVAAWRGGYGKGSTQMVLTALVEEARFSISS